MRNDPFANLSGLDQKLFAASVKPPSRDAAATSIKTEERPDVRTNERTLLGKKERTFQRPAQRTKERPTERRPYDFFRDQLLWLNKTRSRSRRSMDSGSLPMPWSS